MSAAHQVHLTCLTVPPEEEVGGSSPLGRAIGILPVCERECWAVGPASGSVTLNLFSQFSQFSRGFLGGLVCPAKIGKTREPI